MGGLAAEGLLMSCIHMSAFKERNLALGMRFDMGIDGWMGMKMVFQQDEDPG